MKKSGYSSDRILMSQQSMKIEKLKAKKRWQPFRARDFPSLMYPCTLFCFIFGLFPYKNDSTNYASSKIRFTYSTIVLILYISCLLFVLYETDFAGTLEYDSVPGMLQGNCYMLLGGSIFVVNYILTRARLRVLQDMAEISSRLPSKTFDELAGWMHVKDLLGSFFLFAHVVNIYDRNVYQSVSKFFGLYTTLVIFLMDMFYMNCVWVLKACFERINESLINFKEILVTDKPHLLRRTYHEQRNPLLLIELRTLKKRHLQISDIVQTLNMTFSSQIIITVVLTFTEVTFSLYFYILQRNGSKQINVEKQIWFSYFITSIAYYSVKLALMVWACETGKDQAWQIGTNIHEILISTFDKQIKDELELFSLQVLHRENVFSAKGLIMDATLLTKIVSGITTYLLILIQFLISTKSYETAANAHK